MEVAGYLRKMPPSKALKTKIKILNVIANKGVGKGDDKAPPASH